MARGRKAQVNYFDSKRGYYCTHLGDRHCLAKGPKDEPHGPTYLAALKAFGALVAGPVQPVEVSESVGVVVRRWLAHRGTKAADPCYTEAFIRRHGDRPLSSLKPLHVTEWLAGCNTWGSTTRARALALVRTALAWNKSEGHTSINPLADMKSPAGAKDMARGESYRLKDDLVALLLSTASGRWRDFISAVYATGARPGEIANATVQHYDRERRCLIFRWNARSGYIWKNATKTQKDRVIYLTPDVVAIIERNVREGTGYLFPTRQKDSEGGYRRYTKDNMGTAMWKLRNNPAIKAYIRANGVDDRTIICYALRHTYASRAIDRGVNIAQLAVLMGTSVRMLEKHYCHHNKEVLREVFDRIAGM